MVNALFHVVVAYGLKGACCWVPQQDLYATYMHHFKQAWGDNASIAVKLNLSVTNFMTMNHSAKVWHMQAGLCHDVKVKSVGFSVFMPLKDA